MNHKVDFILSDSGDSFHCYDSQSNPLGDYNRNLMLKYLTKHQENKLSKLDCFNDSCVLVIDEMILRKVDIEQKGY